MVLGDVCQEFAKFNLISKCDADRFYFARTRAEFRTAQLQAKRNAELAKRKERELLLMRSHSSSEKRNQSEKLTQDDLVLNASNDVTAALRRTHRLMQAELSRSQFAQETLGECPLSRLALVCAPSSDITCRRTIYRRHLFPIRIVQ